MLRRSRHQARYRTDVDHSDLVCGSCLRTIPGTRPENQQKDVAGEVQTLKAENAVVRELLRKMEEQQRALLGRSTVCNDGLMASRSLACGPAGRRRSRTPGHWRMTRIPRCRRRVEAWLQRSRHPSPTGEEDHYQDGIIIWQNPEDARVPFLLRFNNNTQVRYLNTLDSNDTFTDHLGVAREVHRRNDITVNRSMFILGGYMFDQGCNTASPSGRQPGLPRSSSPGTSAGDSTRPSP